ncbi:hypothetical protein ACLBKS_06200 [Hylemonella sp. W303a]|uniref:hypothetical protein n=1 Tax=Hylemonella sp. W303a TaxID=3389873 RepID=UPI00396AFFA4
MRLSLLLLAMTLGGLWDMPARAQDTHAPDVPMDAVSTAAPAIPAAPVPPDTPVIAAASASTEAAASTRPPRIAFHYELDAYYSNVGADIALTDADEPNGGHLEESEVYRRLFNDSFQPRLFLLEASVNPMPVLGTWYKRTHPDGYDNYDVGSAGGNNFNLIDGVTAGFQEPWAISAFLGSSMKFRREGEDEKQSNRGYMGYLLSCGTQHIHNNVLIDDDWCELEWKLKGERTFREEELSWSFRVGLKEHGNPDIRDLFYVGLRRTNLSYTSKLLSFLNNANVEFLTEFARDDGHLMRQQIVIGRIFPLSRYRVALALDVGLIYENSRKYSGALADSDADELTFVFRPNIKF